MVINHSRLMDYQRPLGDGMSIHTAAFAAFCAAALLGPLYLGGLAGGPAYSAPANVAAIGVSGN